MSDVRHAIFIEPGDALRDFVIELKGRVAPRWPQAKFLKHPPHSTVWVGEVADAGAAQRDVAAAAAGLRRFAISVHSPVVFHDDVLAGGGQTCALAAGPSAPLIALQHALCEPLRRHRRDPADTALPAALRHEPILGSWRRYGFPFAGAHWIPHFTIASLPVDRDDPALGEFAGAPAPPPSTSWRLGWWRVTDDRHDRLAWLPLEDDV